MRSMTRVYRRRTESGWIAPHSAHQFGMKRRERQACHAAHRTAHEENAPDAVSLTKLGWDQELRQLLTQCFIPGVAEGSLGGPVELDDPSPMVHPHDAVLRRGEHRRLQGVLLADPSLRPGPGDERGQLGAEADRTTQLTAG